MLCLVKKPGSWGQTKKVLKEGVNNVLQQEDLLKEGWGSEGEPIRPDDEGAVQQASGCEECRDCR